MQFNDLPLAVSLPTQCDSEMNHGKGLYHHTAHLTEWLLLITGGH